MADSKPQVSRMTAPESAPKPWTLRFSKEPKWFIYLLPVLVLSIVLSSFRATDPIQHLKQAWKGDSSISLAGYECVHNYSVEILSIDPVMIYINGFIRDIEIDHLVNTYSDLFRQSRVVRNSLESRVDPEERKSESAQVPLEDPISQCIIERTKLLLGNVQHEEVEALQLLRYDVDGQFRLHYDWFPFVANKRNISKTAPDREFQRLGTVFVYLNDDCVGGQTYFPHLPGVSEKADSEKYSRTDTGEGLLVNPKKGSAIFWNNMHTNGSGDTRLFHAGLPLKSGVKLGINIFTTYFLDSPLIG